MIEPREKTSPYKPIQEEKQAEPSHNIPQDNKVLSIINKTSQEDFIKKYGTIQAQENLCLNTQETEPSTTDIISQAREKQHNQLNQDLGYSSLISNSIEPSLKEVERFLIFLNDKFSLGLDFKDITILISQAQPNTKGFFSPKGYKKGFENSTKKLRAIVLNTIHLKKEPYETIAHELGHYYNDFKKIKDCSSNQYHNKHFKAIAERLLLEVERTNKGYSQTKETPEFLKMLEEFKPNKNAFHISQNYTKNPKAQVRNFKAVCNCGYIIRCGDKSLKASCERCESEFKFEVVD